MALERLDNQYLMKYKNKKTFVIITVLVVTLLFLNFSGFLSIFAPHPTGFIQYTGRPVCSGTWCAFFDPLEQSSSKIVEINTGKNVFKFEAEVFDVAEKKVCKELKLLCSASSIGSGVPTYIDSDGCQHWKFTYRSIKNWGYYRDPCGSPSSGADCFVRWNGAYCETGDRYGGYYCGVCFGATQVIEDYGGAYVSTTNSEGIINRACYQKIKVYKDNSLIDTLYSESTMGNNSGTYYDDVLKSGVRVDMQHSWFSNSVCSAYQNAYELYFADDSFIMNISSPKKECLQIENVELKTDVINNLNTDVEGELLINYEIPTILGTQIRTVSQGVKVLVGNNTFTSYLPIDKPLITLNVKPELKINYSTKNIDGVNYNFGTGEVVNIKSQSEFVAGTVEEDWSEIQTNILIECYP